MTTVNQVRASRAKYLAIMLPIYGAKLVDEMLGHEPFCAVLNVLATRDAEAALPVSGCTVLAEMISGFALGTQGVKHPFPPELAAAIVVATLAAA